MAQSSPRNDPSTTEARAGRRLRRRPAAGGRLSESVRLLPSAHAAERLKPKRPLRAASAEHLTGPPRPEVTRRAGLRRAKLRPVARGRLEPDLRLQLDREGL